MNKIQKATTSAIAVNASQLPTFQEPLLGWAQIKLTQAGDEYAEMSRSVAEAKKHKWKTSVLAKAASRALAAVTFYEKVVLALKAGYCLFPPVPNAAVIAVRLPGSIPPSRYETLDKWSRPDAEATPRVPLPTGDGKYRDPVVHWTLYQNIQNEKGETTKKEWQALDLGDPVFPLAMAKPEIIAATNYAMDQKVFDEIRMFPFERRPKGDPCILGSIIEAKTERRLYFLISWRIDQRDI